MRLGIWQLMTPRSGEHDGEARCRAMLSLMYENSDALACTRWPWNKQVSLVLDIGGGRFEKLHVW